MHQDRALAEAALRGVLDQPRRAVAQSPDVDTPVVLCHAVAALRRHAGREAVLALCAAALVGSLLTQSVTVFLLVLLAAWLTLVIDTWYVRHQVLARTLARSVFRRQDAPQPSSVQQRRSLAAVAERTSGNVVVHSGYSPFNGSGRPDRSWSFIVDVSRPSLGHDRPVPFTTAELRDAVVAQIRALRLPGLRLEERLLVSGEDVRGDRRFLPDPLRAPATEAPRHLVEDVLGHPQDRVRHYVHISVAGWHGQLVTSLFLRLVQLPGGLFVEANYSLLPPVREEYQEVDRILPTPTARQLAGLAGRCARSTPLSLVKSVPAVVGMVLSPLRSALEERAQQRAIEADLTFDYGPVVSLRERAADRRFQRYFQSKDYEMHVKTLERRVLDCVTDFLEGHGIDASEIQERTNTIINNGVMAAAGSSVSAESISVTQRAVDRVRDAASGG
jgi:hypothetical protein